MLVTPEVQEVTETPEAKDLNEVRQYSRVEVTKQFEKAHDEMMEAIYQVSQHDKEMAKRMTQDLKEIEKTFENTGI